MIALDPLGDRAFLARFADADGARRWSEAVRAADLDGVSDVVLAFASVGVFASEEWDDVGGLAQALSTIIVGSAPEALEDRSIEIPVLYDGEDLIEVAERLGLDTAEVIRLHSGAEYRVLAMGFLPGFPYAGDLPKAISGLPRRDSPRPRVPAGSVAVAGTQTGIYPRESPGGWHLLGRTPMRVADVESSYLPIRAGDRLRFVPIEPQEYFAREGERIWDMSATLDRVDRVAMIGRDGTSLRDVGKGTSTP